MDLTVIQNPALRHLVAKCLDAKRTNSYSVLSTGERLAAAVVLNRFDWLQAMNYTMPEAIDRIGPEWTALLREAERIIADMATE
jgi:hypothetical protein